MPLVKVQLKKAIPADGPRVLALPRTRSVSQDPLEPSPMRVERPPADEVPSPPRYLEASVRRPMAGIGPEARLAGLDERTELNIVVPR